MLDLLNSPNLLFLGTLLKMDNINNNYMLLLVILYIIFSFLTDSIDKSTIKIYIDKKVSMFIDCIIPNRTVSIELTTHTVTHSIGYSDKVQKKKIYSIDFISLLDYIKDINISKKKEILTTQLKDTMFCNRFENNDNEDRYQFIPSSNFYEETLISKDHNIYLKMNSIKNIDDDDNKKENTNDLTACLYCYYTDNSDKIKKINILNDFLKIIRKNYLEKISKKDDKRYIYVYQKSENIDDETKLFYSEHLNEHNKNFNNVIIENKEKLVNYVSKFKEDVDENIIKEYTKMGIPYKAGMLFWGTPGTGKTSTIKAILKETNRHGVIINLSNIESNKELESVFRNRKINNKLYNGNQLCFILEDCDATKLSSIKERTIEPVIPIIEKKDESITTEIKNLISLNQKGFDLSCFLNILDGIIELYGVMIIVTTNHPDKIDEALIRPGRIDFKYEFKKANKQIIIDMFKLKYNLKDNEINNKYDTYINQLKDYIISPADIQCILSQDEDIEESFKLLIKKINEIESTNM